jgi:asparagine N-glycosylation enzyme membrane subunit Stt3
MSPSLSDSQSTHVVPGSHGALPPWAALLFAVFFGISAVVAVFLREPRDLVVVLSSLFALTFLTAFGQPRITDVIAAALKVHGHR